MAVTTIKNRRSATADRGPPDKSHVNDGITTVEQLGPKMSKLPNGSLLCLDVPIARVGWMMYGPGETPITVGVEGMAYVERTAETLFDPKCIGSFMGAAVVDEHPDVDVTPENWKQLSRGFSTTNVRRGEGADSDVLLADLIITDKDLIASVLAGKREVSCGYDADYTQISEGVGTQTDIIGNHIALVEKGRCGPRCAIGDREFQPQPKKEPTMATNRVKINTTQRRVVLDAARQKVKDAEAELAGLETQEEEEAGGATHIHVHVGQGQQAGAANTDDAEEDPQDPEAKENPTMDDDVDARFKSLEDGHAQLAQDMVDIKGMLAKLTGGDGGGESTDDADPEDDKKKTDETTDEFPADEDKDKDKTKTNDSKALESGYKQVMAQAEVLVPGFRMPTFDAAAKRAATIDKMCNARRQAMGACYATADGASLIQTVAGTKDVDLAGMNCKDLATIFRAAAGAKALMNNASATRDSGGVSKQPVPVQNHSISSLNEANRKFWEGQNSR